MLAEILYNREFILIWDFSYFSRIYSKVFLLQRLNIVKYIVWQAFLFSMPQALQGIIIKIFQERLDAGLFKLYNGLYRNSWFFINKKKSGKYRLINSIIYINAVIRRDAKLFLNIKEFVSDFAGIYIIILINIFSGYNQLILNLRNRDFIRFLNLLGLLRSILIF